jgi:hypothetical protein
MRSRSRTHFGRELPHDNAANTSELREYHEGRRF